VVVAVVAVEVAAVEVAAVEVEVVVEEVQEVAAVAVEERVPLPICSRVCRKSTRP
jgi:hypothetical protein